MLNRAGHPTRCESKMRCWKSAEAAGISDANSRLGAVCQAVQRRPASVFVLRKNAILSYDKDMARSKKKKLKQKMRNSPEDTIQGCCEMCKREGQPLSEHHLIPREVHSKKRFIRRFGKEEMRTRKALLCRLCHKRGVHVLIPDNKDLAENFNTLELLMADERIRRHVEWVKKQK